MHTRSGRNGRARDLFEEALRVRQDSLPPGHPDLAISLNNVGLALLEAGELERAEERLLQVLKMRIETYGRDHPLVASPLSNLGHVATHRGDFETALERFSESLAIKESRLSAGHVRIGTELLNLGSTYLDLQRWDEAEAALDRALEILDPVVRDDHIARLELHHGFGRLLLARGELERASEHLREADRIARATRPESDRARIAVAATVAQAEEAYAAGRPR